MAENKFVECTYLSEMMIVTQSHRCRKTFKNSRNNTTLMDSELIAQLRNDIREIKERLRAIEKEQRMIREDILSGKAIERMKKRILENYPQEMEELRKKLDEQSKIEI